MYMRISKYLFQAADRAASLGLTPNRLNESYGLNQSFPRSSLTTQQMARRLESPCLARTRIVSPYLAATARSTDCLANCSLLAQGARGSRLMQNPNKSWAIISDNGNILVNNSILSSLLGYTDEELRKKTLWDLIVKRSGDKRQEVLDQLDVDPVSGDTLSYNGRVVSVTCADQQLVTVSLNIRKLPDSSRYMVYMEPVQKVVGFIDIDIDGTVVDVDNNIEILFQTRGSEVIGEHVTRLIPCLEWPDEEGSCTRFASTGKIDDDVHFPLSCVVTRTQAGYRAGVWVFSSLSGLIILDSDGAVVRSDESFVSLVLGYTTEQITGHKIETIIPGFYDEFDVPSCDKTDDDLGCEDLARSSDNLDQLDENSPLEEISLNINNLNLNSSKSAPGSPVIFKHPPPPDNSGQGEKENVEDSPLFKRPNSLSVKTPTPVKLPMELLTSTPASGKKQRQRGEASLDRSKHRQRYLDRSRTDHRSLDSEAGMPSGCFYGLARHKTGGEVSILYQVKKIVLKSSEVIYCVWVTRDSDDVNTGKTHAQLTLASTLNLNIDNTDVVDSTNTDNVDSKDVTDVDDSESKLEESKVDDRFVEDSIETLTTGDYCDKYVTLDQIGKGAFGCVYTAYRASDKLLVVTKFIRKSKVCHDMWVDGAKGEKIPFEVSLLLALTHPGIVSVMDVFQNNNFVQMVMDKHGEMDLFEFIDRNPLMDEALASVLFRQVVSAVDYLHSREILHRDIKDENIIINNKFSCKLIDFGSATFYKPGQLFNTFYGTVEYCSPEVLKGFPYEGPELEMWSLGVLLYILMFGENPFYNAEDTMRGELHPPHNDASPSCWELIESCLDTDPKKRASLWYIKEHEWVTMEASADDYVLSDVIPCNNSEQFPATHYQVTLHLSVIISCLIVCFCRVEKVFVLVIRVECVLVILRVKTVLRILLIQVKSTPICTLHNKLMTS